jgi:apolipoprotein N-acyltransferase
MALLALYMGLYLAFFCGAWHNLNNLPPFTTPGGKIIAALTGAAIWILLEDLRALFLGGFPWHPLGLTQIDNPHLTWLLPFGGVRLLSGLLIIINIGIYLCGRALLQKRIRNAAFYGCVLLIPIVSLGFAGNHFHKSRPPQPKANRSIKIALIQPNIPQKEKWRPENREKIIEKLLSMSLQNLNFKPDLIIWPEAALPLLLEREPAIYNSLRRFTALNQTSLMLGSPRLISLPDTPKKKLFNSIYLISPTQTTQIYNKIKLVPYGEFTPLTTLFPFISKIVPGLDYSPGNSIKNFDFKGLKLAPSVCFEGVFPAFTARFFAAGADILINLTNDAWFGDSPGPRQHLMNIRLRALENHCTICRCANTGISAIITPDGRIEQQLPLNQAGIITAEVTGKQRPTFYARHPHLPTILAGLYLLLPLFLIFTHRRKAA